MRSLFFWIVICGTWFYLVHTLYLILTGVTTHFSEIISKLY